MRTWRRVSLFVPFLFVLLAAWYDLKSGTNYTQHMRQRSLFDSVMDVPVKPAYQSVSNLVYIIAKLAGYIFVFLAGFFKSLDARAGGSEVLICRVLEKKEKTLPVQTKKRVNLAPVKFNRFDINAACILI